MTRPKTILTCIFSPRAPSGNSWDFRCHDETRSLLLPKLTFPLLHRWQFQRQILVNNVFQNLSQILLGITQNYNIPYSSEHCYFQFKNENTNINSTAINLTFSGIFLLQDLWTNVIDYIFISVHYYKTYLVKTLEFYFTCLSFI